MEARLLKCDDESVQGDQDWVLHGDSRPISICNKFVPGKVYFVITQIKRFSASKEEICGEALEAVSVHN